MWKSGMLHAVHGVAESDILSDCTIMNYLSHHLLFPD